MRQAESFKEIKYFPKARHIRSHRAACSCFPKKVSLQLLSSEQFVGDVWIAQLDRKRVPQARPSGCKSSVAVTAEVGLRGWPEGWEFAWRIWPKKIITINQEFIKV